VVENALSVSFKGWLQLTSSRFESGIEGGSGRLGVANGCPMVAIRR
jgi:hypothetical protein